jgi:class 3 adenylate cyclase
VLVSETVAATFLFTDLVGSTALASDLGPAEAERLRVAHFALLHEAAVATGGVEVKNLGDGMMFMFTSASRALACAVSIQQSIHRYNRHAGTTLSLRIGVSTGEAIEDDGDYFGDTVTEAARLCATAEGGQILTTNLVRALVRRHVAHELVPAGERQLKGLPDPVETVEVRWEPLETDTVAEGRVPLPSRLGGALTEAAFPFSGRAVELAQIASAIKASSADHRLRVVAVGGEPGVGKTTLVAQAARSAHGEGAVVLFGSCEDGLTVPYQPWVAVISHLVAHMGDDVLGQLSSAHAAVLARFVPAQAARLRTGRAVVTDSDTERFLLLEAIALLLAASSVDQQVVVAVDDMQWSDAATSQVIRHLLASDAPLGVTLLLTHRASDLRRSDPFTAVLAELRREPRATRIDLEGLGDAEIIELIELAGGQTLDQEGVEVAHAIRRETDGNPFFVTELLRHLWETGRITANRDGRYVLAHDLENLELPATVRDVISQRIELMGDEVSRILGHASVIGRHFDVDVLSLVSGTEEDALLDRLDETVRAMLVAEDATITGRYHFSHALVRQTIYNDLGAARRQRMHQRVAEVLEGGGIGAPVSIAEIAHHRLAAVRPVDARRAAEYARLAGEEAAAALAPADAVAWFSQALDLLDGNTEAERADRCRVLLGLARSQRYIGDPAHYETHRTACRLALDVGVPDLLVEAALSRLPAMEIMSEPDTDRLAVVDAALELVLEDGIVRARLLAALAEELDPRQSDRRQALADEALELARRFGTDRDYLDVHATTLYFIRPETLPQRLAELDALIDIADRVDDPVVRAQVHQGAIQSLMEAGDLDAATSHIDVVGALAAETRVPFVEWMHCMLRCWRQQLAGELVAAEATLNRGLEIATAHALPSGMLTYGAQLYFLQLHQGRLADDLLPVLRQVVHDEPGVLVMRVGLIRALCEAGAYDEAAELFERDVANGFSDYGLEQTFIGTAMQLCDTAADLGASDAGPRLYAMLAPWADRIGYNPATVEGAASRPLGRVASLLSDHDAAERHLLDALAVHERWSAPYLVARTRLDLADALRRRGTNGDEQRAAEQTRAAAATAVTYGYAGLARRAAR